MSLVQLDSESSFVNMLGSNEASLQLSWQQPYMLAHSVAFGESVSAALQRPSAPGVFFPRFEIWSKLALSEPHTAVI